MGTRAEFSEDELPGALSRLLREGRIRDAALMELYACTPLSMEQLVKCRVYQLEREFPGGDFIFNFTGRRGERRARLDGQASSVLATWIALARRRPHDYIFPALRGAGSHLNARHARRLLDGIFAPQTRARCTRRRIVEDVLSETLAPVSSGANAHGCWLSQWPWVECARYGHGAYPQNRCLNRCAGAPSGALTRSIWQAAPRQR